VPTTDRTSALPRFALGIVGLASFVVGAVAVFVTENGTGTAALLTIGAVLMVFGAMGERIESLELGNAKLRLRAAAAEKYEQAEVLEREGDPETADALRAQARALLEAADPLAARYATVRSGSRAGPERTRAMEKIVADARQQAAQQEFDPGEVARWLREGNDERRIVALALMQGRKELRDADLVMDAIAHSHSAFEQYHALRLADAMVADLDADRRQQLVDVIHRAQRSLRFRYDSDRWRLSERILDRLAEPPADH
jgi:YD repeat-containing protein